MTNVGLNKRLEGKYPIFLFCYLIDSHGKWDKSKGKPGRHKEEVWVECWKWTFLHSFLFTYMLCCGITCIAFTLLHISCLYITREQKMCGTRKHSLWRFSSVATPPEIPICSIPFKSLWIYHPTSPWNFHWPLIFSGTAQSIIILLFCYYSSILKTESRSRLSERFCQY